MNRSKNGAARDIDEVESLELGRRDPLFVKTPEWVLVSGVSPTAQSLYSMLLAHVNRRREDHVSWPGLELLAEMLGYRKKHSVIKYIRELEALGAVTVRKVNCAVGKRNHYVIHETPPAEYAGHRTLNELHADFKARKKVERLALERADREQAFETSAAGAALGSAATGAQGSAAPAAHNQTNPTRRRDPDEGNASSGDAARGGPRASSRASETAKPKRIHIVRPADYEARSDGEMTRRLVASAAAAAKKAGRPLGTAGTARIGSWLTKIVNEPIDVRVQALEELVTHGIAGDGHPWLFEDKPKRPGRPNTIEGVDELYDDLDGLPGGHATIDSMAPRYHPNVIENTVMKNVAVMA